MTKFKFRGFSKNLDRYVYGDLIHFRHGTEICEFGTGLNYIVESDTVEILTGIDTDGTEIYSSDPFKMEATDD